MKFKFLDSRNCNSLLPLIPTIQVLRMLDEYLEKHANSSDSKKNGAVVLLIAANERMNNRVSCFRRLGNSPINVLMDYNVETRAVKFQGIKGAKAGNAEFQMLFRFPEGITWCFCIPLQFILKGWGDAEAGRMAYIHSVSCGGSTKDLWSYACITEQNWFTINRKHMGELARRSCKTFYSAWEEAGGCSEVHYKTRLEYINLNEQEVSEWQNAAAVQIGAHNLSGSSGNRTPNPFIPSLWS